MLKFVLEVTMKILNINSTSEKSKLYLAVHNDNENFNIVFKKGKYSK